MIFVNNKNAKKAITNSSNYSIAFGTLGIFLTIKANPIDNRLMPIRSVLVLPHRIIVLNYPPPDFYRIQPNLHRLTQNAT